MPLKRMEKGAKSMREHPSQEPVAQVPEIACPDVPHSEATTEWRKHCLNTGANPC